MPFHAGGVSRAPGRRSIGPSDTCAMHSAPFAASVKVALRGSDPRVAGRRATADDGRRFKGRGRSTPMEYLKKAARTPATGEDDTRERVEALLKDIESGREARARHYAESLDNWTGDIVVSAEEIARASESLSQRAKDDIAFAHAQVRTFAQAQLASLHEFETELHPGVIAGQKLIPVDTAGCYIPGGRYAPHRLRHHERDDGSGCRGTACDCVLARGSRPRRASRHPAHRPPRGRRYRSGPRRRAGRGVARLRPVHRPCGRHTGRAREPVRGGSQAHPVRAGGHRSVRRADGDRGDRGRDRGCGDRRQRSGGAGGARPGLAGVAGDHLPGAGRAGHEPGPVLHRTPGRAQPARRRRTHGATTARWCWRSRARRPRS